MRDLAAERFPFNLNEAALLAPRFVGDVDGDVGGAQHGADLVTEADHASQKAIHERISHHFPEHGFLGEEGLLQAGSSDYRWIIDPLDGTSNYVHRFPYYAVSIGLECRGELVAGVIYDPTRDEMFSASRGAGATLNGQPIRSSRFAPLTMINARG